MKNSKIFALSIMMMFGASHFIIAQVHTEKKEWNKNHHVEKIPNLTDEQRSKIESLNDSYKEKYMDLKKNEELDDEIRKKALSDLRKQKHEDFKQILTEEQLAEMKKQREYHKSMKGKKGHYYKGDAQKHKHRRGAMIERIDEKVNLTDSQKEKMKEIKKVYAPKYQKLKKDETISKEDKKEGFSKIRKEQHQEMMNVLTDGQREKLKKHHEAKKSSQKMKSSELKYQRKPNTINLKQIEKK